MSKKKRRYSRKQHRKKAHFSNVSRDTHHLCFPRRDWDRGHARFVRQFPYCMVEIQRGTLHQIIHANIGCIPAPNEPAAKEAYYHLTALNSIGALHEDDPMEQRLSLLIAIFECMAQPTADGFKRQLEIIQRYKKEPP